MLRVRTVPSLGGKSTELCSPSTGRNWLETNPRQHPRQGKPFASYIAEFDTGGWDELFPTVDPVPPGTQLGAWGEGGLTDHDEPWYRRWSTEAVSSLAIEHLVASTEPSFEFGRQIDLDRLHPVMRPRYLVRNSSTPPLHYVWAAHPLFRCDSGMSIDIDPRTPVVSATRYDTNEPGKLSYRTWEHVVDHFASLDRSSGWSDAERTSGVTLKGFLERSDSISIGLHDRRSRERRTIADTESTIGYVTLWLNFGGWSGDGKQVDCNIGIDSATASADLPLTSGDVLEPGRDRLSSLTVSLAG
ncbi:MAG: hypothetical protein AAFO89_03005 [Planctomycetota bacterium]